jgi:microcompartment protein CcmK/EutM
MFLAEVLGTVVTPGADPGPRTGRTLFIVRPLTPDGRRTGKTRDRPRQGASAGTSAIACWCLDEGSGARGILKDPEGRGEDRRSWVSSTTSTLETRPRLRPPHGRNAPGQASK